jgi:hypothetical protein
MPASAEKVSPSNTDEEGCIFQKSEKIFYRPNTVKRPTQGWPLSPANANLSTLSQRNAQAKIWFDVDNALSKPQTASAVGLSSFPNGPKTKNSPQSLWSLAPLLAPRKAPDAGRGVQAHGHSADHAHVLGTKW